MTERGRDVPVLAVAMALTAIASIFNVVEASNAAVRAVAAVIFVAAVAIGARDLLQWRARRGGDTTR